MTTEMKKPGTGESRANRKVSCAKSERITQQDRVLEALKRQPMSAAELQCSLWIADARAVVRDLKAKGIRIEKHLYDRPSGRPIQRYHLVEPE
ncbi:helix-turn-helix domain-containing protein [Halomonas alimentaria]|uniref:helix-turn-helix domain-containing protein n=1 Tax=Halomonas alimentaria TaxID=147248 RepID=UPI00248FCED5|nr:helix-turn-helix domain-containing protein [Halomonas alimentaria]